MCIRDRVGDALQQHRRLPAARDAAYQERRHILVAHDRVPVSYTHLDVYKRQACARAVHRLSAEGQTGCNTLFDVPPAYLSPLSAEELRASML